MSQTETFQVDEHVSFRLQGHDIIGVVTGVRKYDSGSQYVTVQVYAKDTNEIGISITAEPKHLKKAYKR